MKTRPPISLDAAKAILSREMYRRVGLGCEFSFAEISARTGITENRLYHMRSGQVTPGIHEILSLMAVLGPGLSNALLRAVGQGGAHWIDGDGCPVQASAAVQGFALTVTEALADDGRIDHREMAVCIEKAQHAAPLVSAVANSQALAEAA